MIRRKLNKSECEDNPHLIWNACIDLLAMEDFADLSDIQKPIQLIFWYNSEVMNGGHFQYFVNPSGDKAEETIRSLGEMGLSCQREILQNAFSQFTKNPIVQIDSVDEFVDAALEGDYAKFDDTFHKCRPSVDSFLEEYLENHLTEFVDFGT